MIETSSHKNQVAFLWVRSIDEQQRQGGGDEGRKESEGASAFGVCSQLTPLRREVGGKGETLHGLSGGSANEGKRDQQARTMGNKSNHPSRETWESLKQGRRKLIKKSNFVVENSTSRQGERARVVVVNLTW